MPASISTLALDDSVLVSRSDSQTGLLWVKEIILNSVQEGQPGGHAPLPPPPPPPGQVAAYSWDKVIELAGERPLLEMHLIASSPAASGTLAALAQVLGPESLTLTVTVSGAAKDGGNLNFAASQVKLTNPTRPLVIAQTLFNAVAEDCAYEADLAMKFGDKGRTGLAEQLRAVSESAHQDVAPRATFDKPAGESH